MTRWTSYSQDEKLLLQTVFASVNSTRLTLTTQLASSKSKINTLVAGLIEQDMLIEAGLQQSSGGRCAQTLMLNPQLGVIIAIDIGATSIDIAILLPNLQIIQRQTSSIDVCDGPCHVLSYTRTIMRQLLQQCQHTPREVIAIGIGVPGPVDFEQAQLVNPPLMPEWDGFSIRDYLRDEYDVPIFVDNDVNLMALGELWSLPQRLSHFLVIKVGTGIGCGIICQGQVYRGVAGSAGDVGHICVDQAGARCRCGNLGCVEAMAAAPAIVRMAMQAVDSGASPMLAQILQTQGILTAESVGYASKNGDGAAHQIIQQSGSLIGQMLASVINFYNPSHVFIGGGITQIGPLFLAAVRQSIYQRSLALSTRHLQIQYTSLAAQGGIIGAGVLAMQETLRAQSPRKPQYD